MTGIFDPQFFDRLHQAGVTFRTLDDPMATAGYVAPLITVGNAGLFAGKRIDAGTLAEIHRHAEPLRIFVGAFGLSELVTNGRVSEADGRLLSMFLTEPETLDRLLRREEP